MSGWDSLKGKTQKSWRNDPVSEGQESMIDFVTHWTGEVFTGSTKGEASDFISNHKPEADENMKRGHESNSGDDDDPAEWGMADAFDSYRPNPNE